MERYKAKVEARIDAWCASLPNAGLYPPMTYLLKLPAKRVRPVATLMACELFGGRSEDVLDEALGIELFHNFTLMHDDIMDASPLRRGDPTVHVKWDVNAAILSGDALFVKAYALMGRDPRVLTLFNRYALEVCEGQQSDMEFERRDNVGVPEYMGMIRQKTAVLLSCALQIGALLGGASDADRERIGHFGEQLGLAFQLRDDLLDAFGDPAMTGKQRGGDLRNGKKTALLLKGLEQERIAGTAVLRNQLGLPSAERDVSVMIDALERTGARSWVEEMIGAEDRAALTALAEIEVPAERRMPLLTLARGLMARTV